MCSCVELEYKQSSRSGDQTISFPFTKVVSWFNVTLPSSRLLFHGPSEISVCVVCTSTILRIKESILVFEGGLSSPT